MRIYRTVIEYLASCGAETHKSQEEAIESFLEGVSNIQPLHERGTDTSRAYNRMNMWGEKWTEAWKQRDASALKQIYRRAKVEEKLGWRAERIAESLEAPALDEVEKLALAATANHALRLYREHEASFPLYVGSNNQIHVSLVENAVSASFRRGRGVYLSVTERSLRFNFKRVYNDQRKIAVLDYVPVTEEIAYVAWAYPSKVNKQPLKSHGAFCEGAFIPGYSEGSIRAHIKTIQMQARIMETNRALGVKG